MLTWYDTDDGFAGLVTQKPKFFNYENCDSFDTIVYKVTPRAINQQNLDLSDYAKSSTK